MVGAVRHDTSHVPVFAKAFNNPAASRGYWTAPATSGPVTLTFTADDGSGGVTTETLTVTVTGP